MPGRQEGDPQPQQDRFANKLHIVPPARYSENIGQLSGVQQK
jgi:hypothetical protein